MDIQTVRDRLSQGEIGQALEGLIALLETDTRFKGSLRALRVVEANYNAVRLKERKGILSLSDTQLQYNRVADIIVGVLDDLEAGRTPKLPMDATTRWKYGIVGMGVLFVVAFALWRILGADTDCPGFDNPAALHILVLPFDDLGGDSKARPELRIQNEIKTLTGKAGIPVEVKLNNRNMKDEDVASFAQIAEHQGKTCKADLVVYGQFKAYREDSIRVNMGFRFLKGQKTELNLPFKTYKDITQVQVPRDLEDALFSLCAMIALREDKRVFAQRWMNRIKQKDTDEVAMTEWLAK